MADASNVKESREAEPAHKKQLPEHDVKQSSDNSSKRKSEEVNDAESNKKKGNFSMTMKTDAKPALKMTPFSMNLGGVPKKSATVGPLKMSLPSQVKSKEVCLPKRKSTAVSQAFQDSSEEDEEEMPLEARMRMKNKGRFTPTAAGPNSFGKNNLGFCDRQKIIQREMEREQEQLGKDTG